MRTPVAVAGEVGAECVAMAAEAIMVCEAAAEVVTMVVVEVVTTAVVIAVVAIMEAVVAIMEAVVAIMAAVSTPVASITVTVTVIIVAATVMVIGAAVFGSRPASSATAHTPAVIARGSTTTTTNVGCMNANKHTQRAAVSRMGYPMIGKPARSPDTVTPNSFACCNGAFDSNTLHRVALASADWEVA